MPPKGKGRGRGLRQDQSTNAPGHPQTQTSRGLRQDQSHNAPVHPQAQTTSPPLSSPLNPPPPSKKEKLQFSPVDPQEVGLEFERKVIIEPELPPNPGPGKLGKKIGLITNHYKLNLPSGYVYHYDIEILSRRKSQTTGGSGDRLDRCLNTKRNREVVTYMLKTVKIFKNILAVYDGKKNIFTRRPLDLMHKTKFPVVLTEDSGDPNQPKRTDAFEVEIQPVEKKDTGGCAINLDLLHAFFQKKVSSVPQEILMALETILRNVPCQISIPVGRSFFSAPAEGSAKQLGGGREIWFGYHQSVRLGQHWPTVNLNTTATTFYHKGPVLDYIADFLRCSTRELSNRTLNDSDVKLISKELKQLQVKVTHLKYERKYRILSITRERADRIEFNFTGNNGQSRINVSAYFANHHGRPLQYPNLPCIKAAPKEKNIYLPIEVCEVVEGQHCRKKLEERQNAEMIKFTARPPEARFTEIARTRTNAKYESDIYLKEFGITVEKKPLALGGRVLEAPNVRYNKEVKIKPRDGVWDMRDIEYFKGAQISKWVLLSFSERNFCRQDHLEKFARMLSQIGSQQGINIDRPALIEIVDRAPVDKTLTSIRNKYQPNLIVCVVPSRRKHIYGDVKQAAETLLGLTTQCVKDMNVVNCKPALVSNLCQKINAKAGGTNNSLTPGETPDILRRPVIFIGADVNHPAPSIDVKPSIAAAVGSLDAHPSRYAVTVRAQRNVDEKKKAIEYILDLKDMVVELLKAFYRSTNGKKPEKIIFYRDGVSEGQFGFVKEKEVGDIRKACESLSPEYKPGITFIVVQKRHHTRFITQDYRDGVGKMKNIPPGTTVDTDITHPTNFDFFLCSHFGLQGTSRPGHYTVIEDDNKFTADDLQKLTYYLCHTYVRCTRSVSIPAPVNYAHLAAYRARVHLSTKYDETSGTSDITVGSDDAGGLPEIVYEAIRVQEMLKNTMYFV